MRTQRPTTECDRCQSVQEVVGGGGGLRVEVEEGGGCLVHSVFLFSKVRARFLSSIIRFIFFPVIPNNTRGTKTGEKVEHQGCNCLKLDTRKMEEVCVY